MENKRIVKIVIALVLLWAGLSADASGRWEQLLQLTCARAFLLTSEGIMLASDKLPDYGGGIYISEDGGKSWTKADVPDHHYNNFYEIDSYIFALGESGYIARSSDGGRQWEELFYCADWLECIPWGDVESCDCYAMTKHKGRIYIANFAYLGVMYTEDYGDTWHCTSRAGMEIEDSGVTTADNLYNILSYEGELYAFAVTCIYRYNTEADHWNVARDGSNLLTVTTIHRGTLVAGRGMPNDTFDADFLEKTADGIDWTPVQRPVGLIHNNVRSLAADDAVLIAGTSNYGIFATCDFGSTWQDITEGMPLFDSHPGIWLWPLCMQIDNEYVYAAFYNPGPYDVKDSGIWRLSKSVIADTQVISSEMQYDICVERRNLKILGDVQDSWLTLYNSVGVVVLKSRDTEVDLSSLSPGIYVWSLSSRSYINSGKIILN